MRKIILVVCLFLFISMPVSASANEERLVGLFTLVDTSENVEDTLRTLYETLAKGIYTEDELNILYRITEAEAEGLEESSKILVVHTILNRVKSEIFPNTIKQVVFQCDEGVYQFTPMKPNGRYHTVTVTPETIAAVNKAVCMEDTTDGALFFFAMDRYKSWSVLQWINTLELVKEDESSGHKFYKYYEEESEEND